MKRLLCVVVLLLIAVAAVGFYQGWFRFSRENTDQETNFTITVDEEKIRADKEKVLGLGESATPETADRSSGENEPRP